MAISTAKKVQRTAVWVILGLTGVGLLSFGAGSFGGGGQSIGQVGEKRISAQTYFTAIQNDLRTFQAQTGQPLTFVEAQSIGLQQQTLSRLVTQRALDNEAVVLGLSVGDTQVRDQILAGGAFVGLDGAFDRTLYADALRRNGMTEASYETQIREDLSRQILQIAVIGGIAVPPTFSDTLMAFAGEERSFAWALMTQSDLTAPLPAPTEEELRTEYAATPEAYTRPETKEITYAWLTPDMILDSVAVDEEALRALYDDRRAEFVQPERRLVERLVFGNTDQAAAARARIDAGGSFEDEVSARGLVLVDVDLGDVLPSDLGPARDAVFAAEALSVVGPLNTSLGPALFRVNGILAAQETSFEEARDRLQDELALDRSARIISDNVDFLENELAGGATLEDLAEISDMELGTIAWFPGAEGDVARYTAFQQAAAAVSEGDFPEIAALDDGGVFALRLDGVAPPELQPFEEVREAVAAARQRRATVEALTARADDLRPQIAAGLDMATLGLTAMLETGITRGSFVPGAPVGFLEAVFDMQEGEVRAIPGDGAIALVRLDRVSDPDTANPNSAQLLAAIQQQIAQSYAQDLYAVYAQGILDATRVQLDQRQINGIHAQIQ